MNMSDTPDRLRWVGAILLALLQSCATHGPPASVDGRCDLPGSAMVGEAERDGWRRSYRAGCPDRSGRTAAGSEVLHLVPHGGRLYAAVGYWMDPRNPLYGAAAAEGAWAQVLRLDGPDAGWQVDLEMPRHLRAEALHSATFLTDGKGNRLQTPARLLLAAAYAHGPDGRASGQIDLFTRDGARGQWDQHTLWRATTGGPGEHHSVRALRVYRDRVTGIDRLFVTLGRHGIRSGVYDAEAPGHVQWDAGFEIADLPVRPLALAEADDALYVSTGARIMRRIDGPQPRWEPAFDLSGLGIDTAVSAPAGGIRGLSRVRATDGRGDALIFVWSPGADASACVYRVDHPGRGQLKAEKEVCLRDLVSQYLGGHPVRSVLAAYNDFHPVVDPANGRQVHLIGMEAWIAEGRWPTTQTHRGHGFYAGALYAVRDERGGYRLHEVNGPIAHGAPPLVAPRSFTQSPFVEDGDSLYVGGYDCNFRTSSDTAWVFRAPKPSVLSARCVSAEDCGQAKPSDAYALQQKE